MNAIIITPAYSHAHHGLLEAIMRSGLPWLPRYEQSDLVKARSVLIGQALDRGAEVVVFVDADNVPAPGVFETIAKQATPERAVFGVYTLRGGDRLSVEPLDEAQANRALKASEPFPIAWGGLGLVAVHRDALWRVRKQLSAIREPGLFWHPYCLPFVEHGVYHADDRSLCMRLRRADTELVADPRLRVGHAITQVVDRLRAPAKDTAAERTRSRELPHR